MTTAAFVQARMGSTRLPGKVLAPLAGRPMLAQVLDRLARVPELDRIMVLTTTLPEDDPIATLAAHAGVACVRGDSVDVLGRFHAALMRYAPHRVLRITADCPFVDPEVVSDLIALFDHDPRLAYAGVATGAIDRERGYRRFPDGLDAEVATAEALDAAHFWTSDPYDREHVTPYLWRNPFRFPATVLEAPVDMGDLRWTVDTPDDLMFAQWAYDRLGEGFDWRDVLALLDALTPA